MEFTEKFISEVSEGAIEGWHSHQILPSITIAQAILESDWGRSELAINANNLFGIKGEYNGYSYAKESWEVIDGEDVTTEAHFRHYPDKETSMRDHAKFFTSTPWREENYVQVVGETDYKKVAQALSDAGYATDPAYARKLINIIETYDLTRFDMFESVDFEENPTLEELEEQVEVDENTSETDEVGDREKLKAEIKAELLEEVEELLDNAEYYIGLKMKL